MVTKSLAVHEIVLSMLTPTTTVHGSSEELLSRLVAAKFVATSVRVRGWYDGPETLCRIRTDLAREVDRVSDTDFAASLRQQCPFPGVSDVAAYKNRILQLQDGALVLTGIRFRGGDLAKPFVDVLAAEGPLDAERLDAIAAQVEARWAQFRPLCARFLLPDDIDLDWARLGPRSRPDLHLVAGRLDDLASRPLVHTAARVTLLPPGNLAFFDRYAKIYADLFASHPKHREYNLPQDKEALAKALQEGLLFEVLVDGSWAGIVSALPQAPAGLTGFTVQEMLLDQAHRGQGFGPAMQQRLIEHLRGQDDAVLAGTIHAGNVASLASARRAGRDVIATYVWVTPTRSGAQGMPGLDVQ